MVDHIFGNSKKPYTIKKIDEENEIRYFKNFKRTDLVWHRDEENRTVELINGSVELQLDNQLPVIMETGKKYTIPKMVYHRVISNTDFILKIQKY